MALVTKETTYCTLNALSVNVGLTLRPQRAGFKFARKLLDEPPLNRDREVLLGVDRPELFKDVAEIKTEQLRKMTKRGDIRSKFFFSYLW